MTKTSPQIGPALNRALRAAGPAPQDVAAVTLARRLAVLIDRAESLAAELEELRPEDESTAAALVRLRARVDAQTVASDLGPKLLACLTALGLTPAGRATSKGGASVAGLPSALDRLRAARKA